MTTNRSNCESHTVGRACHAFASNVPTRVHVGVNANLKARNLHPAVSLRRLDVRSPHYGIHFVTHFCRLLRYQLVCSVAWVVLCTL